MRLAAGLSWGLPDVKYSHYGQERYPPMTDWAEMPSVFIAGETHGKPDFRYTIGVNINSSSGWDRAVKQTVGGNG